MSVRRYRLLFVAVVMVAGLVVMVTGLVGGVYAWRRYTYPYGPSHCCDKVLYSELFNYAENNGGNFPAGEATPEASLSLIQRNAQFGCGYLLCGKSGSESVTQAILDRGELLSPDTCGWNYVEGLRPDDDSRLALFWDKEGLGHGGKRLASGGHIVMFVSGFSEYIPATKWDEYLAEQKILFAQRKIAQTDKHQTPSP